MFWLVAESVKIRVLVIMLLLNNENLYAMVFLKKENDGKISGKEFRNQEQVTSMFDLYFKDDIQGEKIIVFNSKIRKMYFHKLEHLYHLLLLLFFQSELVLFLLVLFLVE